MLAHEHPSNQLSDYVLNLLSPAERRRVERHLASCDRCRNALQAERNLMRDVQKTLQIASRPSPARLGQLMPPPAVTRRRRFEAMLRPALAFSVVVVLFVLSLQIYPPGTSNVAPPATATSLAATATSTPTSTTESTVQTEISYRIAQQSEAQLAARRTPLAALYSSVQN